MKYISIFVFVAVILGGGLFFYNNNYKKSAPAPITTANQNTVVQASSTPEIIEQSASTSTSVQPVTQESNTTNTQPVAKVVTTAPVKADPARASAVAKLQTFLNDWKSKYKTDCTGKETTDECTIWRASIEKLETTCFQSKLTGSEIDNCGKNILDTAFQSAFWSKASEAMNPTTKSTVDSHGTDLALLPEGQTVKVFKSGPTEESPFWNETTVTYLRTGDTIKISSVNVYDDKNGSNGRTSFSQTVSLK
jgi:hypothetical protein